MVFQTYFGFFLCICLLLVATARMKYFSINEESANVHDITEMVRSSFEDQTLILVQSNGCRLEDTEATRGISCAGFWIFLNISYEFYRQHLTIQYMRYWS